MRRRAASGSAMTSMPATRAEPEVIDISVVSIRQASSAHRHSGIEIRLAVALGALPPALGQPVDQTGAALPGGPGGHAANGTQIRALRAAV